MLCGVSLRLYLILVRAYYSISPDLYFVFFIVLLFIFCMRTECKSAFQFIRISTLRF